MSMGDAWCLGMGPQEGGRRRATRELFQEASRDWSESKVELVLDVEEFY